MQHTDSKKVYNEVYKTSNANYGGVGRDVGERFSLQLKVIKRFITALGIDNESTVLEVGCGLGRLHDCHPKWHGIEYSGTAVVEGKNQFGERLNIMEGDARNLPVQDSSVDLYFSFAALEHVPEVEKAFLEIERVVSRGGFAVLSPAWNCRPWTVKKLEQRPYGELSFAAKVGKLLIPIRNSLAYRFLWNLPSRLSREVMLFFGVKNIRLSYLALEPDFSLWTQYPHISDDDAFVSMDAHAAITYFASRGWGTISHPNFRSRFFCRGEEVVVQKKT
jgi:ubiquinone/menaquinone biosynthesis C-methylase UbiE